MFQGRLVTVRKDRVTTPAGTSTREIVEHCGGVAVAALKEDGTFLMERQYRYTVSAAAYEVPAGKLEDGEDPEHAALRELREETGYRAGKIRFLTKAYPSIGFCTELLYFYLCTDLTPGRTDFDDSEAIELIELPFDQVYEQVLRGETIDAKAQIAVLMTKAVMDSGELAGYLK